MVGSAVGDAVLSVPVEDSLHCFAHGLGGRVYRYPPVGVFDGAELGVGGDEGADAVDEGEVGVGRLGGWGEWVGGSLVRRSWRN